MKIRPAPLLAALTLTACTDNAPTAADNPTATQTVAYIALGLEDGATLLAPPGEKVSVIHQKSATPLIYETRDAEKGSELLNISVNRLDGCRYAFSIDDKKWNRQLLGFSLDFSGLKSATRVESNLGAGAPPYMLRLEGAKMTCEKDGDSENWCEVFGSDQRIILLTSIDTDRLAKSVKHFQGSVCKR